MMSTSAVIQPRKYNISAGEVSVNENDTSISMSSSFASLIGILNATDQLRPQKRLRLDFASNGAVHNNASSPDDERDSSLFASNGSLHSPGAARSERELDSSDFEIFRGGSLNPKLLRSSGLREASSGSITPRQHLTVADLRRTITWRSIKRNYEFMMQEPIITSSNEKLSESESDSCMKLVASINASLESAIDKSYPRLPAVYNSGKKSGVIEFFQQVNELNNWFDTLEARLNDCDARDAAESRCERLVALDYLLIKLREKLPFIANLRDSRRDLAAVPLTKASVSQVDEQFERLEKRWHSLADSVRMKILRDAKGGFEQAAVGEIEWDVTAFADWINRVEQSHFVPFREYVRTRVNLHDLTVVTEDTAAGQSNLKTMLETHQHLQVEIEARSRFITAVLKACDMLGRRVFLLQRDSAESNDPAALPALKKAVAALQNDLHQKWLEWLEFKFLIEQLALVSPSLTSTSANAVANANESATSNESSAHECDSDEASGTQTQFQLELEGAPLSESTPATRSKKRVARQRRNRASDRNGSAGNRFDTVSASGRDELSHLTYATSADSGKSSFVQTDQFSPLASSAHSQLATPTCFANFQELQSSISHRYVTTAICESDPETPRCSLMLRESVLPEIEVECEDVLDGGSDSPKQLSDLIKEAERLVSTVSEVAASDVQPIDDASIELAWDPLAVAPLELEPSGEEDHEDDADARACAERFDEQIWDLELSTVAMLSSSLPTEYHSRTLLNYSAPRRASLVPRVCEAASMSGSSCDEQNDNGKSAHKRSRRANGRRRAERHFELRMKAQIAASRRKEQLTRSISTIADCSASELGSKSTLKVASASNTPSGTPRKRGRRSLVENRRRSKQIRRALFDDDATTSGRECETATDVKSDAESIASEPLEDGAENTVFTVDSLQQDSTTEQGHDELLMKLSNTVGDAERSWSLLRAQVADSLVQTQSELGQNITSIYTVLDSTNHVAGRELRNLLNAKADCVEFSASPDMTDSLTEQVTKWTQFGTHLSSVVDSSGQFLNVLQSTRFLLEGLEQEQACISDKFEYSAGNSSGCCETDQAQLVDGQASESETLLSGLNEIGRTVQSVISSLKCSSKPLAASSSIDDSLLKDVSERLAGLLLAEFMDLYRRITTIRDQLEMFAANGSLNRRAESVSVGTATSVESAQENCLIYRNVATDTQMEVDVAVPVPAPVPVRAPSVGRRMLSRYAKMCLLVFGCLIGLTLYFALIQSEETDSQSCEYNAMIYLRSRFGLENRPPPV